MTLVRNRWTKASTLRVRSCRPPRGIRGAVRLVAAVPVGPSRLVPDVREVDLRQDFDRRALARLDDADVVLCVEAAVPEREDGPVPALRIGRLGVRESLQIAQLVLTQSRQRLVLLKNQYARRRAARTRRRQARDGGACACPRRLASRWVIARSGHGGQPALVVERSRSARSLGRCRAVSFRHCPPLIDLLVRGSGGP